MFFRFLRSPSFFPSTKLEGDVGHLGRGLVAGGRIEAFTPLGVVGGLACLGARRLFLFGAVVVVFSPAMARRAPSYGAAGERRRTAVRFFLIVVRKKIITHILSIFVFVFRFRRRARVLMARPVVVRWFWGLVDA